MVIEVRVYWLSFKIPQGVCVVVQPASSLIEARMKAHIDVGCPGEFQVGHQLDAKLIKRIPKNMIGKCLSQAQAARLLSALERGRKRA
jgi:hypothetical protein